MIKLENISKKYNEKIVINNFSYCFNEKGFYFIVGKSGSGKTTLLNLIGELELPTSGNIYGNDDVSYVFQDANLFSDLTVLENIILTGVDEEKVLETLKLLSIYDIKDKKVNVLSGGEKQRVSIARAFVMDSKTILLDEPTGNLDDENSKQILNFLKEKSNEKLIIMVTHDNEYPTKYGDIILYFENGNIIEKKINEIDADTNFVEDKEKKKPIMRFKYQFLYSIRLLFARWGKYVISLILCTLSLTLLFFVSAITFNDVNNVVQNGINNDIRNYYKINKNYYNSTTNENISHFYGEIIEGDLKNIEIDNICYYRSVRVNNGLENFNLIIENSDYEGVIITDFLSKYIFENENSIGGFLDIEFNFNSNKFKIEKVEQTNYAKVYDLFLYDDEYRVDNIDDLNFHYRYLKMSINSYKKYFEKGVKMSAANFTFGDIPCSRYVESFYNLNYFYDADLSNNDVYVSKDFYNRYMGNVQLPAVYSFIDIRSSINAAKYYDYLNMHELFDEVNVVGIIDSNEKDVYVSKDKYDQLISKQVKYEVDGICISDGFNVDRFHEDDFKISDNDYKKIYTLNDIFNNQVKVILNIVSLVIVVISFLSLYFSVVGFMDKKSKEIFIMKSMKISKIRIINIFILYILYVIFVGTLLSFVLGNIGMNLVNNYIMHELLKINIIPFIISYRLYLLSISLIVFTALIILMGPLYKLNKIDSAILIKKNL